MTAVAVLETHMLMNPVAIIKPPMNKMMMSLPCRMQRRQSTSERIPLVIAVTPPRPATTIATLRAA